MSTSHSSTFSSYLVSPQELHTALRKHHPSKLSTATRIIPLCGSWFLPNDPQRRTGHNTFIASRIPNARFFDLDKVCDTASPYPHMLPTASVFAKAMGELGIRPGDEVVVYDSKELGIFSAPRVAWTLKIFGHRGVHILNNFRLWVEEGLPTESGEPEKVEAVEYFVPEEPDAAQVISFSELKELVAGQGKEGAMSIQVLDARPRGRWEGTAPEPRPGLPSGHMPSSISVSFDSVLDPQTKAFLSPNELTKVLESKGVAKDKAIISSCGTGVTAVVLETALKSAGWNCRSTRVYDGSWTEWAQRVQPNEKLILKA